MLACFTKFGTFKCIGFNIDGIFMPLSNIKTDLQVLIPINEGIINAVDVNLNYYINVSGRISYSSYGDRPVEINSISLEYSSYLSNMPVRIGSVRIEYSSYSNMPVSIN